ncbi:MAG: 50S ribosomal protein L24 [Planctomycetota bacterium]
MHVKRGDQVIVISGNDKGTTGEVLQVDRGADKVLVQGVNIRVKHEKPTQANPQGERVEREFPIHSSNVMLLDPSTGKGTRKRPTA